MNYQPLTQLINLIEGPNKDACLAILEDNKERFETAPGSLTKHHAWPGGYIHHLEEAINLGCEFYNTMNSIRILDFTISDVVLVLFLHDLEKPFRYVDPKKEFNSDEEKKTFIKDIIEKYNITLTENHQNALEYVHGEGDAYSRTERVQKPLAAFVHVCDVASARIWFDFPKRV